MSTSDWLLVLAVVGSAVSFTLGWTTAVWWIYTHPYEWLEAIHHFSKKVGEQDD